jgi:hypothetical protein
MSLISVTVRESQAIGLRFPIGYHDPLWKLAAFGLALKNEKLRSEFRHAATWSIIFLARLASPEDYLSVRTHPVVNLVDHVSVSELTEHCGLLPSSIPIGSLQRVAKIALSASTLKQETIISYLGTLDEDIPNLIRELLLFISQSHCSNSQRIRIKREITEVINSIGNEKLAGVIEMIESIKSLAII